MPASMYSFVLLLAVTALFDSVTPRVGGSGGDRTITLDCGAHAFIVGATAGGGRDNPFGFNLVRRVSFRCRSVTGSTVTAHTATAAARQVAASNVSNGGGDCGSGYVAHSLELYAATFIDRFATIDCLTATEAQSWINVNVGGDGGSRAFLECRAGEGLYKIVVKAGDAIDSMTGYCRTFTSPSTLGVPTQINSSASPPVSLSRPVDIPPGTTTSFTFVVSNPATTPSAVSIGITGETDLLGGSRFNPPEYRIELLDPSGRVVGSKTVVNPVLGVVQSVSMHITVAGKWRLRVTNLKKVLGTLRVTSFGAFLPSP